MTRVTIFYSIRSNDIRFFADKDCATIDQKLEGNELTPKIGEFVIEMQDGFAYVDAVATREDYVKELEEMERTPEISKAIIELRR